MSEEQHPVAPMGVEMSIDEMIDLLRDVAGSVKARDSLEGSFSYEVVGLDRVRVMAVYRIGNSMGQGGIRLVRDEEAQSRIPIEPLPPIGSLWHVPGWERDWAGPWKVHLARQHEFPRPGAVTLTKVDQPDLAHIVPDYCWPWCWVPWEPQETEVAKEVPGAE